MVLAVLVLAGCESGKGDKIDPLRAQVINAAVGVAAETGCALIPAADRESAARVLDALDTAAAVSVADAWTMLEERAHQAPLAWIWSALHNVIGHVKNATEQAWFEYARGALGHAVRGCRAGIGLSPA